MTWYPISGDMLARDLWTQVPLDHGAAPGGPSIDVFAREVVDARARDPQDLPLLLYLQGGPGGKSPRPIGRDPLFEAALKRFRVILLDQRGTGRSTPVQATDVANLDAREAAELLSHFRADSIVRDAEEVRRVHFGGQRWWTIGQSYGGFLTLHYLSFFPEALEACVVTGGLPSIDPDAAEVYRRTYPRVLAKNEEFFTRFPHLRARVDKIADLLARETVLLPDGDQLTVRRFQTLGLDLGMGPGADRIHWLLDEAFADREETTLSETFLATVAQATSFATNPLFIVLQEAIYGPGPTSWAAQAERPRHPEFEENARPLLFTGEMAYPWMLEEIRALRPFEDGGKALIGGEWPIRMYDTDQLARNRVPVEAVIYSDDMYVDAGLSLDTASRVGEMRTWVTNEFEHDGIRMEGVVEKLFDRLDIRLARATRAPGVTP